MIINKSTKLFIFLLRISLGWILLYAGLNHFLDPGWSAQGYLMSAKTFPQFYQWLAGASNIEWVNLLNMWGPTLIGASLILGLGARFASVGGFALMLLYYFPVLVFPAVGEHSYIVDEHIIYAMIFGMFAAISPGQYWGIDGLIWRFFLPKPKGELPLPQSPLRGIARK